KAGAKDHDLSDPGGDLAVQHVIEVPGPRLDHVLHRRKARGDARGGFAARGTEEELDHRIQVDGGWVSILFRAVFRDNECSTADVLDRGHEYLREDHSWHDRKSARVLFHL